MAKGKLDLKWNGNSTKKLEYRALARAEYQRQIKDKEKINWSKIARLADINRNTAKKWLQTCWK
mgnify:CR=1 FL=1